MEHFYETELKLDIEHTGQREHPTNHRDHRVTRETEEKPRTNKGVEEQIPATEFTIRSVPDKRVMFEPIAELHVYHDT